MVKGSGMSTAEGVAREVTGEVRGAGEKPGCVKGWEDKRRMACVREGWKRPPCGECLRRWQGRTWPAVKKAENVL